MMEPIFCLKFVPKRLVLYGFCFSLFFFCAFYTYYSVIRTGAYRPVSKFLINDVLNRNNNESGNIKNTVENDVTLPIQIPQSEKRLQNRKMFVKINDVVRTKKDHCELEEPKKILLWTPFFGLYKYLENSSFEECLKCKCEVTTNRKLLLESDAVIFHCRDMSVTDIPVHRLPQQYWVFYCLEAPPYSDFPGLQFTYNMFNLSMTYRQDSDVISDYGLVKKIFPKRNIDKETLKLKWSLKTRSVVWMSSHCPTNGGRDDFVQELKKYIDVDTFGSCGDFICPLNSTNTCFINFASTYKFFLAFENAICKDYVTEKFFRTFSYDIIPVVFGGANYQKIAPPNSYIDALSFKSPKHLAFFLAGVGGDFNLYFTYFQWRTDFAVQLDTRTKRNCALCSILHGTPQKVYSDIRKWWVQDGQCKMWRTK